MKKAIVLLSGGIDSTTVLAIAKEQGFICYALSFDYSQKNSVELERAKYMAKVLGAKEHRIVKIAMNEIGGSAMTDQNIAVPDHQDSNQIPSTYVPARNTIFLSFALGFAEVMGAQDIFYGANILDYSGYPDCRPEYMRAFEQVANLATKKGVEGQRFNIHAPLITMHKREIIAEGIRLGIDYSQTLSCYRPDAEGRACGGCDSCTYRKKGFLEAGVKDPTLYRC